MLLEETRMWASGGLSMGLDAVFRPDRDWGTRPPEVRPWGITGDSLTCEGGSRPRKYLCAETVRNGCAGEKSGADLEEGMWVTTELGIWRLVLLRMLFFSYSNSVVIFSLSENIEFQVLYVHGYIDTCTFSWCEKSSRLAAFRPLVGE